MKLAQVFLTLLALVALVFSGLGVWATKQLFEEPYFYYGVLPIPVLTKQVQRGHELDLVVTRCSRAREEHVYPISRRLVRVDKKQDDISLTGNVSSVLPGCTVTMSNAVIVPAATPPGRYRLVGASEVGGKLRNLSVPWESEPFEVIE